MKPNVHILATVRKPELLAAALLVFRTIRTGFPENSIYVWGNALDADSAAAIGNACGSVGAQFQNTPATSHDAWIEACVSKLHEPFWICDTDVVFFSEVPLPKQRPMFAGRYEPEFHEEFTDTIHVERLHTAVMYLDPIALRCGAREHMAHIPDPWRASAQFPLVRQTIVPRRGEKPLFYDTLAALYHAGYGTPFTPAQDAAFAHLHCGTYADEVVKHAPSMKDTQAIHARVYQDLEFAKQLAPLQAAYYASRSVRKGRKRKGT